MSTATVHPSDLLVQAHRTASERQHRAELERTHRRTRGRPMAALAASLRLGSTGSQQVTASESQLADALPAP